EQNGDATGQLDQAGTDEGDGEQRNQRAGLQQHGAADAEQQALEWRRGAARQQLFELAAGQLAQPLLEALHAEQEQRQPGAEFEPAATGPERPGQCQHTGYGQEELDGASVQGGGLRNTQWEAKPTATTPRPEGSGPAGRGADDADQLRVS